MTKRLSYNQKVTRWKNKLVTMANKGIPSERHLNSRQWQQAIFRLRQRGTTLPARPELFTPAPAGRKGKK